MSTPNRILDVKLKSHRRDDQWPLMAPSYNIDADLAAALARAVEESGLSRDQVCDRLNVEATRCGLRLGNGKQISKETLDKWLSPSEPGRRISVPALALLCGILEDRRPLAVLAAPSGFQVIGPEEIRVLRYGHAILTERKAGRERRKIEKEIQG